MKIRAWGICVALALLGATAVTVRTVESSRADAADAIADTGLPAEVVSPSATVATSNPRNLGWGVATPLDPNDQYATLNTFVTSIEVVGDLVVMGGKFNNVRNGPNAPLITQKYLAVFNKTTGAWRSDIRPVLDGAVWALKATPDGKLLVAGNFSSYNGAPNTAGLVKIDPNTGQLVPGFSLKLTGSPSRVMGKALDFKGDWAYLAGRFNNAVGGPAGTSNLGIGGLLKFKWSDGTPAPNWRPWTNLPVDAVAVSNVADRLWIGGWFTTVSGTPGCGTASVSMSGGVRNDPPNMQAVINASPIAMCWNGGEPTRALKEVDGAIYVAGTQHFFGRHDATTFAQTGYSTQFPGDYQAVDSMYGWVYGSCHCGGYNTTVQVDGKSVATGWISGAGAWTTAGFVRESKFQPDVRNWSEGPHAIKTDPIEGCVWLGGDWTAGSPEAWASGFAKFCAIAKPGDVTPPSAPTGLAATWDGTGVKLSWNPSTDNLPGALTYEVIRTVPTAVTNGGTATTWTDPVSSDARYFVRAVDAAGNKSATTPVLVWSGPAVTSLVKAADVWRYKVNGAPEATWATTSTLTGWLSGAAPLGLAMGQTTAISLAQPTQYFVKDLNVTSLAGWGTVEITVRADDGFVLRLNGKEVTRDNMSGGAVAHTTTAWSEVTAATGKTRVISVPASMFKVGVNRLAVELHQIKANDTDAIFAPTVNIVPVGADLNPPAASTLTSPAQSASAITLAWTRPADTDLAGYILKADGETVATLRADETGWVHDGLAIATRHSYELIPFDRSGNLGPAATLTTQTRTDPPSANTMLVPASSVFRYRADVTSAPDAWTTTGDISTWPAGAEPFGNAFGAVTTVPSSNITQYYVAEFNTITPGYRQLELTLAADDAAVVRINGVEVARTNLPFGTPDASTLAYAAQTGNPQTRTFRVPADMVVVGKNRVSVEVHQSAANDVDGYMNLQLKGLIPTTDNTAPSVPNLTAAPAGGYAAQLNWPGVTDNVGLGYFEVLRNGTRIAVLPGSASGYLDQQLAPATAYAYQVVAVDTNGNRTPSATVSVTTGAPTAAQIGWPRRVSGSVWTWTPNAPYASYVLYDGTTVVALTTSPSATLNLAIGTHTLTVVGVFADGTRGTPSKATQVTIPQPGGLLRGVARQSSTYGGSYPAGYAIDGSLGTFSHTEKLADSFWEVDLGSSKAFGGITLWNRQNCCPERLDNAWVLVSDTPMSTSLTTALTQAKYSFQMGVATTTSNVIPLSGTGRYVRVELPTAQYLSMAEVEIFPSTEPTIVYPA